MKPVPRYEQPREIMMLDDAEMALALIDLAETAKYSDIRRVPAKPAKSEKAVQTYDAIAEFRSAARMIMDEDEIEAAIKDLEHDLRNYPAAA
jgi:hypothetical protein